MNNKICTNINLDYTKYKVGDTFRIPFYCFVNGAYGLQSVTVKFGQGEASIEDIISKLPITKVSTEVTRRHIRDDFQVGFGVFVPEYNVVSVDVKFPEMAPIACYQLNEAGQMKYISHPQISMILHRHGDT